MRFDGFEWDRGNSEKITQHGLSQSQVEAVLLGDLYITPDPSHSKAEQRYWAIGQDALGRYVFVVLTLRRYLGALLIRPISARYMHRKEVRKYEEAISKNLHR